mmetsp:Transcript_9047/g.23646  ORF Transcript_9047/g.23646 Transcript_9047/m.23646 type:complete len:139 (+) Transcript_9047:2710-3126(+)
MLMTYNMLGAPRWLNPTSKKKIRGRRARAKYKSHVYKSVTRRSRDSHDVATVHRRRGRRRRQEDVLTVARPEAVVLATRAAPPNVSSTVDSTITGHSNGDDSEAQSFADTGSAYLHHLGLCSDARWRHSVDDAECRHR